MPCDAQWKHVVMYREFVWHFFTDVSVYQNVLSTPLIRFHVAPIWILRGKCYLSAFI